jgi:flagellar hook-associated protein 1 FlgK
MTLIYNALSGALAAQAALNTTSQNIANLQTKGYTRQGVLLSAIAPGVGTMQAGNGVQVSSLLRFSDSYKTQQLWRTNTEIGTYTESNRYLTQLEQVMGDDKTSLSHGLDAFFAALNAVGGDPTSSPLRQAVVTAADAMSQGFNSIYSVTRNQQISVSQQRDAIIPQFNTVLKNIATLNQRIQTAAAVGTNTSALIDERDQQIDQLSNFAAIEVLDQPDGSRSIALKGGQPLVSGRDAATLSMGTSSTPVLTLDFANSSFALDDTQLGGQLGGLGNFEKNTLLPLQQSISDIAQNLASLVNTQLSAGSNGVPPTTPGIPLFSFNPVGTAGILSVMPGFKASDLALSGDGTPGDSGNLQLLIAIKNQTINVGSIGSVQVGDADTQLVGKLGVDSAQNQSLLKTATTIRQQAEDDWASTSSVNKDEEAIDLVQFQNMYQANMRVITVANTLFDATLGIFG